MDFQFMSNGQSSTHNEESSELLVHNNNVQIKTNVLMNKANENLEQAFHFFTNSFNNPNNGPGFYYQPLTQPNLTLSNFHYSPPGYSPNLEALYPSPPSVFQLNSVGSNGTSPTLYKVFPTPPSKESVDDHPIKKVNLDKHIVMYRNLFHPVECSLPIDKVQNYEGWRIFVDEEVGYAGNAKIFKKSPDVGERALILSCKTLNPNKESISQCKTCHEYFESRDYFKANPHIKGRITLVKCNNVIRVEHGAFKISMKHMCCCKHHMITHFLLSIQLRENIDNKLVGSIYYPVYVKQWRKSTQKKQSCYVTLT